MVCVVCIAEDRREYTKGPAPADKMLLLLLSLFCVLFANVAVVVVVVPRPRKKKDAKERKNAIYNVLEWLLLYWFEARCLCHKDVVPILFRLWLLLLQW